jgi:hypothetical protein
MLCATRWAKSGGALIQQFMTLTFSSLANSTPYLRGSILLVVPHIVSHCSRVDRSCKFFGQAWPKISRRRLSEKVTYPTKAPVVRTDRLAEQANGSESSPSSSSPIQ